MVLSDLPCEITILLTSVACGLWSFLSMSLDYGPSDLHCQIMVLLTSLAYRLRSFLRRSPNYGLSDLHRPLTTVLRSPSPDYGTSDHHRLTTVFLTYVVRLRSFQPTSLTNYSPADQTNISTMIFQLPPFNAFSMRYICYNELRPSS